MDMLLCVLCCEIEKVSEFRKELDNIVFEAAHCQCADCAWGAIQYMLWMFAHCVIGAGGGLAQTCTDRLARLIHSASGASPSGWTS